MQIYFIRHGDPDYQNDCLTPAGHEQAKKLAAEIEKFGIQEFYSSPMGRAQQTAAYSAEKLGLSVKNLPWLHELMWGEKLGDAKSRQSPWTKNDIMMAKRHGYPEGDGWKTDELMQDDQIVGEVEEKCRELDTWLKLRGFERQGQLYKVIEPAEGYTRPEKIAFVCHGGTCSALISYLLDMSFWQVIAHMGFDLTSVTRIDFPEAPALEGETEIYRAARLGFHNDTTHLR